MSDTTILGIDIGGSGIKGAPVDVATGRLLTKRHRIKTPRPATPDAVMDVAAEIVRHFEYSGPVGCTLPAVVRAGVAYSAANIDPSWIGTNGAQLLEQRTGCPVVVINDADAAGIAELRFGAARGEPGTVLLLTFGTGIGSALFYQQMLVPNTELGHLEFRGMEAEHYCAARLVEEDAMRIDWWASRVGEYLRHLERVLSPELFVFGGGISKRFDTIAPHLETEIPVRPAALRNNAGIVGAAMAAYEELILGHGEDRQEDTR